MEPTAQHIKTSVLAGCVPDDRLFDQFFADDLRVASTQFWTPLRVALTVGSWLSDVGARTVLDIGSGPGKFCVAASLVSRCAFFGIEHRPRLVAAARSIAQTFGVEHRVSFIEGAFGDVSIEGVDAVYLYNPFGENLRWYDEALDETVPLGAERFRHDVWLVERFLGALPSGVHLVTYNGFGGRVPDAFVEVREDDTYRNPLRMWRKA